MNESTFLLSAGEDNDGLECRRVGFVLHDAPLVLRVELLDEDERENGVRTEPGEVRCEAFPEAQHAFSAQDTSEDILEGEVVN